MKNKFHTPQFFSKLLKKRVATRDPRLMHPEREWAIGLSIAIVIFIGAAFMSVYTYFSNQTISVYTTTTETTEDIVYRESIVKEVLGTIEDRAVTLEELQSGVSPGTEPDAETSTSTIESETSVATTTSE